MDEELHTLKAELLEMRGSVEVKGMRIEELEEQIAEMEVAYENNRTSELGLPKSLGSSGKVIHNATDDLRSLDMGSDGLIEPADNTFRVSLNFDKAVTLEITFLSYFRLATKLNPPST